MTSSPKVTVLMSVFNGERWLKEAIESVLTQTLADFEFVIVNDGSTDSSWKILHMFQARDQRVFVIDKENTGLTDSLNVGINRARGEWIARIDADDLSEPHRLQRQLEYVSTYPEIALVGSGLYEIDEAGAIVGKWLYPTRHANLLYRLQMKNLGFFPHSSAFYRTQVVRAIGGYRTRIRRAQDYDLWLRLSERTKMACIPEPLVRIRKHENQVSHEDAGRRQITDSRVALVSYLLRQRRLRDPVDSLTPDTEFQEFRSFVYDRLDAGGVFEFRTFVQDMKAIMNDTASPSRGIVKNLVFALSKPRLSMRFFQWRLFGERLAPRIADEWALQQSICAD